MHAQGYLHGKTYSPLEWLHSHEHIHRCNETVGRLFSNQILGNHNRSLRRTINRIAGELHDNVASHSRGRGFSAAQVYGDRIEYAIADAGCGFLFNARRAATWPQNDWEAIHWAFVRGNTSAVSRPPGMEFQRGFRGDDYGLCAADDDAHAGWGLDELRSMIDQTNGVLWVASGACAYLYSNMKWQPYTLNVPWNGVFIEFQLPRGG